MIATKPPLAGWMSAVWHFVLGGWWEGAWRVTTFLGAFAVLGLLFRFGNKLMAGWGGLLAASAFGLNLIAPRLATLVRTDMLMGALIFGMGLLIYQKVRTASPWTTRDRWLLFALAMASVFTKGPIAYAVVLPGVAWMMWWKRREPAAAFAWSGWWPWLLPLVPLAAWAVIGSVHDEEFYQQVMVKEFFGRVTGEHKSQPVYYYLPHLLQKFAPWSLLLIALACVRDVRAAIRKDPSLAWLAAWALGGLLVFSLIPSKRTDRMFPIMPPLCLLLPGMMAALPGARLFRWPLKRVVVVAIALAVLISGGYTLERVVSNSRQQEGALAEFGGHAREVSKAKQWNLGVVTCLDEGLVLYAHKTHMLDKKSARAEWANGTLDALILPDAGDEKLLAELGSYHVISRVTKTTASHGAYIFVSRTPP
jgi:4-amino-4-deoxy-L-arabinose transferase-like glycosyltransferase